MPYGIEVLSFLRDRTEEEIRSYLPPDLARRFDDLLMLTDYMAGREGSHCPEEEIPMIVERLSKKKAPN
ncbi:MAG: hypothetical protein DWQ07_15500 [Chloroflexi bacterium]|nr:MAG: hypothetical protein DWQ07_15500 [Chloroflexota bacterium]MBL1197260.1 hypothetical protein [Chloroflexota bacterium]NOH14553.1 hypothetical protein [Chloroflexota bacterium]